MNALLQLHTITVYGHVVYTYAFCTIYVHASVTTALCHSQVHTSVLFIWTAVHKNNVQKAGELRAVSNVPHVRVGKG